jgi:hypothetical protein
MHVSPFYDGRAAQQSMRARAYRDGLVRGLILLSLAGVLIGLAMVSAALGSRPITRAIPLATLNAHQTLEPL